MVRWEVSDEVHGAIRKWSGGFRPFGGDKGWFRGLSVNLKLLACPTSLDVIFDKGSQTRPPVVVSDSVVCFEFTWVACGFMVMKHFCNVVSEFVVKCDIILAFVEEDLFSMIIFC